jgi:hypothetical protein
VGIFGSSEEREERATAKEEARGALTAAKNHIDDLSELLADASQRYRKLFNQQNADHAQKWEYMVLDDIDEEDLDRRGARGWELVNAAPYTTGFGLGGNERMTVHMRYVFKRPIANAVTSEMAVLQQEIAELNKAVAEAQARLSDLK